VTTRTAVVVWTLALLAAVGAFSVILMTDGADGSTGRAALGVCVGLAFIVAGLVSKHRRPDSRMGWAMVVVGFTWFVPALTQSGEPVLFSLGAALADIPWAAFAYLIFAYPTGRLETRSAKAIVATAAVITVFVRPLWTLFGDLREMYPEGAENVFLIQERPQLADAIERTIQAIALILIASTIVYLVRRWRQASAPLRRTLSPVYFTFGGTIVLLALAVAADVTFGQRVSDVVFWITLVALLTVPLSFAVGLLRTRLARAGVGPLLVELGEAGRGRDLRDALGRALGDPTLEVGYWIPELNWYVDSEGKALPPPGEGDGRWAKIVERHGKPVAALIHDESLRSDPELLDAVGAAAALALENEQRVAALSESEARLRALVDAVPDLMFRLDREGTYLDVKGSDADLVLPANELIGRKTREVLPPDVGERIMACVGRLEPGSGVETVEYQLRLGPLNRHFEARIAAITDDEVVMIVRDISDRKRTELQLQRLQEELRARFEEIRRERDFVRAVVQAAPSLFCLVDHEGRIVRFNKALEETFGFTDEEPVRGQHFWEVFIAPEEADEVRRNFLDRPGENETKWITSGGERLTVAWRVTQLVEERGEARFLITGMDIHERKRQEEELRSSRARIVEAGDVERRRLERNLHDGAQQRLVSISLFLRLAEGKVGSDPDGAGELLGKASEELTLALEELRELARGIHPAILTDRGLEPALEALASRAAVPVSLETASEPRLPEPVEAAAYYVVSEALANVAKYAQASGATVRIARLNGRAVVEVADDGVGGADPVLGSGLRGLADRVEALDGRLEVESAPGKGTTVRAEIPVP
jgi:PAS domain S-box-containing protein